jgi:hypothetical protein
MRRAFGDRSRLAVALLAVLLVGLGEATLVRAESAATALGHVRSDPLWIVALPSVMGSRAAGVLGADGTLWHVIEGTPAAALTMSLASEQVEVCGDAVLAVERSGRLVRVPVGPEANGVTLRGPAASLLHRPLCLPIDDGALRAAGLAGGAAMIGPQGDVVLVDDRLAERARAEGVRAMPDGEFALVDLGASGSALALLAAPTQRYRHGVLGDEVEAGAVVLLALPSLAELGRWTAERSDVIEERRVTAWRSSDRAGLHLTISNAQVGARVLTLSWHDPGSASWHDPGSASAMPEPLAIEPLAHEPLALEPLALEPLARGHALGRGGRWLHVIAAIDERLYVLHTPHTRGPLVRYELASPQLAPGGMGGYRLVVSTDLGGTSHVLGERNLDRAALVAVEDDDGAPDRLALTRGDLRAVVWVACTSSGCRSEGETLLPARLATNLAVVSGGSALLVADVDGGVWWIPVPEPSRR